MTIRNFIVSTAAACATVFAFGATLSVPAAAYTPQQVKTNTGDVMWMMKVRYSDLDLTSDAGRASFETRVRSASRKVCGATYGARSIADQQCRSKTFKSAEPRLLAVINSAGTTQLASNDRR